MPSKSLLVTGVALIAGTLALGGCGSNRSSTSAASSAATTAASSAATPTCPTGQVACVSQNPAIKVSGPTDLATNLFQLMKSSNPTLRQVRLTCAAQQQRFPKVCALDGVVVSKRKLVKVQGRVSVFGVDTKTHTYAYAVNYSPVSG